MLRSVLPDCPHPPLSRTREREKRIAVGLPRRMRYPPAVVRMRYRLPLAACDLRKVSLLHSAFATLGRGESSLPSPYPLRPAGEGKGFAISGNAVAISRRAPSRESG